MKFIAVDIDPSETPAMVVDYAKSNGFPWTFAMGDAPTLQRFKVLQTDTKFVVDSRGVITYQAGSVGEDAKTWQGILQNLVAT